MDSPILIVRIFMVNPINIKMVKHLRQVNLIYISLVSGCFVHGLYLEGAGWNRDELCLIRQRPKQLIQELPILKIIPIEAHRLKLQVSVK